ncbi:thioesterase domain-containing protein [Paenibacillus filicis]|uniref:Thioesterase domain-containing protein n=1 Tax=Paenibacillus filicis TaxID=669464 RepID=A0ABU9DR74_9BACL
MRLFGFPHCGGQENIYGAWSRGLPSRFRFETVELKEASRLGWNPSSQAWTQAVEEAGIYIASAMDGAGGGVYGLIGHCSGGLLAFEASHWLKACGMQEPAHLFVSGCSPPHLLQAQARPDLGTGPSDPALFPDACRMAEAYRMPSGRGPLLSRLSVFAGRRDPGVHVDSLAEWGRYTARICDVHIGEGEHAGWGHDADHWLQFVQMIMEREYPSS